MPVAAAIRPARIAEAGQLEDLQRAASARWPETREQLAAYPDAVELPVEQLRDGLVRVAEAAGEIVGFGVLLPVAAGACELDGLFVAPQRMGAGVGRLLVSDAVRIARGQGAERIEVVANPNACGFYERVGFCGGDGGEEVATRFGPARRMWLWLDR